MGWGSGSQLMDKVIAGLEKEKVPEETRKVLYGILIPAMQDCDWDTEMDCMGQDDAFDATLKSLKPDWFTEER